MCRVAQRQFPLVLTVQKTVVIPQLQFLDKVIDDPVVRVPVLPGRSHARCLQRHVPVVGAVADSHGLCDHRVSPVARRYGGRCPYLQVVQICLSWRRGIFPWSRLRRTIGITQLLVKVIDAPVVLVVRVPQVVIIPVATLRLIPVVSLIMEIPQLFLDEVVDVLLAGGASSTGAVVEKTVVPPQLHLLRNSLRAAHQLRWGLFLGPVHRYRAGGRVHRDTASIIRCTVRSYRQRHVRYRCPNHHHHHHLRSHFGSSCHIGSSVQ